MPDSRDADTSLLAGSGRHAEALSLTRRARAAQDPLQAVMGIPSPVWENQETSKLTDGQCVIFGGLNRCGMKATRRAWIGCTVGEHLDASDVCEAHGAQLETGKMVYHCRRCWDAVGEISRAQVIKVERIDDDDDGTPADTGRGEHQVPDGGPGAAGYGRSR